MKNFGEIRVTQRTAVGKDDSGKTELYVVRNAYSNDGDISIMPKNEAKEMEECNGSTTIGTVTIIHPYLLWGTWEENLSHFIRIAYNHLEEEGLIESNDFGTYFEKEAQ